jgi:hypothetical protein
LLEHRIQPEICDSSAERTASGKASGAAAAPRTTAALRVASALHPGGDLGSGSISLVSATEGLAAQLDALDRRQNVYTRLGVKTVINCRGTWTYLSGSLEFPEVREAQLEASQYSTPNGTTAWTAFENWWRQSLE